MEIQAPSKLVVIGDSHSQFWSGKNAISAGDAIEGVRTISVGAGLAHSLNNPKSKTQSAHRVRRGMMNLVATGTLPRFTMLSFGEIDIRVHALRVVAQEKRSLEDVITSTVGNYLEFLQTLKEFDTSLLVWGPPASQPDHLRYNESRPVVGSERERNVATALFAEIMADSIRAAGLDIRYVSIFEHLLRADGRTEPDLLYDGVHVSQAAMPAALAELEDATGWRPNWRPPRNVMPIPAEMRSLPGFINIASLGKCRIIPKSLLPNHSLIVADKAARAPAQLPPGGKCVVDLGVTRAVQAIIVDMPEGELQAVHDKLLISADGNTYQPSKDLALRSMQTSRTKMVWIFENKLFRFIQIDNRLKSPMTLHGIDVLATAYS